MKNKRKNGGEGEEDDKSLQKISKSEVCDFCILKLPEEILLEIFLRLPVKAAMKCKLVCKSWYILTSERNLIDSYFKNPPFTTLLLPHYETNLSPDYKSFNMIEINKEGEFIQTRLEPKVPGLSGRDTKLSVIGSSNGLLCFSLIKTGDENETRYVANPVMGEYIELPQLKREPKDEYVLQIFGFSPSTNNFKVMIVDYNRTGEGNLRWKVSILTVGVDDKWRHLPNPCPWSICFDGVLVNGAFHWIIYGQRMIEILTFNLCEEKFDRISRLPVVMHDLENMNLAAINNKLCVIDYKVPSIIVTIWTMQEYGVLESWTKDVVSFNCFSSGLRYPSIVPIATLPNGEILFHFKFMSYIISYNPIQKTCSVIEGFNAFQMLSYAPRLLSLKHIIFGEEAPRFSSLENLIIKEEAPRFSSLENLIIKEEAPRFSSLENVIVGEEAPRFASVENVIVGENVAVTNHLSIRSFIFISSIIGMFINYCALLKTKFMGGRGRGN